MVLAPFREEESPSANAVVSELVSERERERGSEGEGRWCGCVGKKWARREYLDKK
jgi:hypothetical protein